MKGRLLVVKEQSPVPFSRVIPKVCIAMQINE